MEPVLITFPHLRRLFLSVKHFYRSSNKPIAQVLIECFIIGLMYYIAKIKLSSLYFKNTTNQYSVHTLLSHNDLPFYIIVVCSFLRYLQYNPKFITYDDGSLTDEDFRIITAIPRVFIVKSSQATTLAKKTFGEKNSLLLQRINSPLNRKLIDILLYKKKGEKVLILDSDVLFFSYPDALLKFLSSKTKHVDMTYIQDMQNAYVAPVEKLNQIFQTVCPPRLNSGVLAFRSDILNASFVTDYFRSIHTTLKKTASFTPWIEQTGYAILASRVKSKPLPETYSVGKKYNQETVCKHYVHDARGDYGINLLKLNFFIST